MVVYLDSGDPVQMHMFHDVVDGFTTNPTLLRGAPDNWKELALKAAGGRSISFEVFSDTLIEMGMQAVEIASWGENVYVKIPVSTTKGESTAHLMKSLGERGIKVNATAICTMEQIETVARSLVGHSILSIFAGRIADTGRDPVPFITKALHVKKDTTKILWASTREVYNYTQAQQAGCDIITMSPGLISKMNEMKGKDLKELSLLTVKQFHKDSGGLSL